jgi:hypothetical protein
MCVYVYMCVCMYVHRDVRYYDSDVKDNYDIDMHSDEDDKDETLR